MESGPAEGPLIKPATKSTTQQGSFGLRYTKRKFPVQADLADAKPIDAPPAPPPPAPPPPAPPPPAPPRSKKLSELTEQELWACYFKARLAGGELAARFRQYMISYYFSDVKAIAGNYSRLNLPRNCTASPADIEQTAMLAHCEAIDRYELNHGTTYIQFAYTRIRGAIIDSLRGMQNCRRSTPGNRRLFRSLQESLSNQLGHHATIDEVVHVYGDMANDAASDNMVFGSVFNNSSFQSSSNDGSLDLESDPISSVGIDDTGACDSDDMESSLSVESKILELIGTAEEGDRNCGDNKCIKSSQVASQQCRDMKTIVWLYYYMGMTTMQIADIVGRSVSSVSTLKHKALKKLRAHFTYEEFRDLVSRKQRK